MPMPKLDTKGIDFATLFQVLGAVASPPVPVGTEPQPTAAPPVAEQPDPLVMLFKAVLGDPQLLGLLIAAIAGLLRKQTQPAVQHPPVTIIPQLPPSVSPAMPVETRTIAALNARIMFIENGAHQIINKAEFDAIRGQDQPAGHGYRFHLDITPSDASGMPFYNDDLPKFPELFAQDPKGVTTDARNGHFTAGEGNNRIEHHLILDGKEFVCGDTLPGQTWDGQSVVFLTSEYDDAAMTPVITVSRDLGLDEIHKVSYYAVWVGPKGERVQSGQIPTFVVHAWDDSTK